METRRKPAARKRRAVTQFSRESGGLEDGSRRVREGKGACPRQRVLLSQASEPAEGDPAAFGLDDPEIASEAPHNENHFKGKFAFHSCGAQRALAQKRFFQLVFVSFSTSDGSQQRSCSPWPRLECKI